MKKIVKITIDITALLWLVAYCVIFLGPNVNQYERMVLAGLMILIVKAWNKEES